MLIPIRQLAEDWPGRFVLITAAILVPLAIVVAVLALQSGATPMEAVRFAFFTFFLASMPLAAPSMLAGFVLVLLPRFRGLGGALMMYGAGMGAFGFGAIFIVGLLN